MRFSTLIFLLHKWAADFHNVFPNVRKQMRPIDLWNESAKIAPPAFPISPGELDIALGEHHSGKLSHEGIRYAWLNFANDQLRELMASIGKDKDVDYVVSRENLSAIYVKDPRNGGFITVSCTRPD